MSRELKEEPVAMAQLLRRQNKTKQTPFPIRNDFSPEVAKRFCFSLSPSAISAKPIFVRSPTSHEMVPMVGQLGEELTSSSGAWTGFLSTKQNCALPAALIPSSSPGNGLNSQWEG